MSPFEAGIIKQYVKLSQNDADKAERIKEVNIHIQKDNND